MRDFHVGDILSLTTDYLVSSRGMRGVDDIVRYMVGAPVLTHMLLAVAPPCKAALLAQHPDLADADCTGIDRGNVEARLASLVARYGETRPVAPLVGYEQPDPIAELARRIGGAMVVTEGGER